MTVVWIYVWEVLWLWHRVALYKRSHSDLVCLLHSLHDCSHYHYLWVYQPVSSWWSIELCVCVCVHVLYEPFCLGNTISWSKVKSMCVRDTERRREGERKEKIKPLQTLKTYSYCNCFSCGPKLFSTFTGVNRDFIVVQIQKCLPLPM